MNESALLLLAIFGVIVFVVAAILASRSSGRAAQPATPPDDLPSGPHAGKAPRDAAHQAQRPQTQHDRASGFQIVRVQHVIDGDTVVVSISRRQIRVRLYGIDCPETGQPWGDTATAGLIKLIRGRAVTAVTMEIHGLDQYGRTLATLYAKHHHDSIWINVNERMIMLGHAWVTRKYYDCLPASRQDQLFRLERWARSKRVGLWKTDNPVPPWRWRQEQVGPDLNA